MIDDLTSIRSDLTWGVKSKTHRRQCRFNAFNAFNAFSLKGYASACGRTRGRAAATYLQRNPVKRVKCVNSPAPSCDSSLTPVSIWCEIRCKIAGCER